MSDVTLDFIPRQQDSLLAEFRVMRDDMTVMMEILRRVETRSAEHDRRIHSLASELASIGLQLTAMHAYNRRVEERVHRLEEARS